MWRKEGEWGSEGRVRKEGEGCFGLRRFVFGLG